MMIRKFASKYALEPLFWRLKGIPVFDTQRQMHAMSQSTIEEYTARSQSRLADILDYALQHAPFYMDELPGTKESIRHDPVATLKHFPVIGKAQYRYDGERFLSDQNIKAVKNTSGGSTGEPVIVWQDQGYKVATLAASNLVYFWAGRDVGDSLVKLWGAERDLLQGSYGFKQHLSDIIGNRKTINAFNLSKERMRNYVAEINARNPRCLEGYADALTALAKHILKEDMQVVKVDSIITSAGTLLPQMRVAIEEAFRGKVFDRYGCREVGNIAAECKEHTGLHILGETNYVELLDSNNKEVAEGEEGRVVITNLVNRAMPLIRYDIGDYAVKGSADCSCGLPYPKLASISGRVASSIIRADGTHVSPNFFAHLFGVMQEDPAIFQYQVLQSRIDHLDVRLVSTHTDFSVKDWGKKPIIEMAIRKIMGDDCGVSFSVVDNIEKTPTGKQLHVVPLASD